MAAWTDSTLPLDPGADGFGLSADLSTGGHACRDEMAGSFALGSEGLLPSTKAWSIVADRGSMTERDSSTLVNVSLMLLVRDSTTWLRTFGLDEGGGVLVLAVWLLSFGSIRSCDRYSTQ